MVEGLFHLIQNFKNKALEILLREGNAQVIPKELEKRTRARFAEILGVSRRSVNEIVLGQRPITVDMAIRIGKALGNGPLLWLNLQQKVDIWDAVQKHSEEYEKVSTVA